MRFTIMLCNTSSIHFNCMRYYFQTIIWGFPCCKCCTRKNCGFPVEDGSAEYTTSCGYYTDINDFPYKICGILHLLAVWGLPYMKDIGTSNTCIQKWLWPKNSGFQRDHRHEMVSGPEPTWRLIFTSHAQCWKPSTSAVRNQ